MKVVCYTCKREMDLPFMKCHNCGWEPDGEKKEIARKFAKRYIKESGNDPELKIILENATKTNKNIEMDPGAEIVSDKDLEVKCHRCEKEMIFPFLECTECGWVARREWRRRAKDLSELYIGQHKDREENLRIIWEEENHRSKK